MTCLDPEPADRAADAAGADRADAQLALARLGPGALRPQDGGQAEHAGGDQQRAAFDIDGVAHRDLQGPVTGGDAIIVPSPGPCNRQRGLPSQASLPEPPMSLKRRDFLHTAVALGAPALGAAAGNAVAADAAPKDKLRILILGGTGFTGPHQVRYALARGHHVTLFNRGRRPQPWPGDVVELTGDRNTGDLKSLDKPASGTSASTTRRRCRSGCATPAGAEGPGAPVRVHLDGLGLRRQRPARPGRVGRDAAYAGADPMAETQDTLEAHAGSTAR